LIFLGFIFFFQFTNSRDIVADASTFYEVIILFIILITFTFLGESFLFYTEILEVSGNDFSVQPQLLETFFLEFFFNKDV